MRMWTRAVALGAIGLAAGGAIGCGLSRIGREVINVGQTAKAGACTPTLTFCFPGGSECHHPGELRDPPRRTGT